MIIKLLIQYQNFSKSLKNDHMKNKYLNKRGVLWTETPNQFPWNSFQKMPVPIPSLARPCISFAVLFKKAWTKKEKREKKKKKGQRKKRGKKLISDITESKRKKEGEKGRNHNKKKKKKGKVEAVQKPLGEQHNEMGLPKSSSTYDMEKKKKKKKGHLRGVRGRWGDLEGRGREETTW